MNLLLNLVSNVIKSSTILRNLASDTKTNIIILAGEIAAKIMLYLRQKYTNFITFYVLKQRN